MITFVATAYKETIESQVFLSSLILQTNPNWNCIVYCDEPNKYIKNIIENYNDERIRYYENIESKGWWGHENRKFALENLVDGDFIIQTSIQDYYVPKTVEIIESLSKSYDFIYFNCLHNGFNYEILYSEPKICRIDWGSFAVKTEIAKKVGISEPKSRITDGIFVEEIFKSQNIKFLKVNKILTIHN